ncbi:MAG: acyltransferase family protein [Anaerolineaceae bacterium]
MQTVNELTATNLMQSAVKTEVKSAATTRTAYIDMARGVLIILVIMLHAAITYGGSGDWTYIDAAPKDDVSIILLSLLVVYIQAFSMSLYFFFSGLFTPASYDKKGPGRFWKDRIMRLAIPMLVYTFLLSKIPNYLREITNNGLQMSIWEYSWKNMVRDADGGPTWFLFALLIFSAAYTIFRVITRKNDSQTSTNKKLIPCPTNKEIVITTLVMSGLMFLIGQVLPISEAYRAFGWYSLILAFFPFYIIFFCAGILAYRNQWLDQLPKKMLRLWSWLSLALLLALPIFLILTGAIETGFDAYISGFSWRCAIMCLWMGFSCTALSITLTLWLREKVNNGSRLASISGSNNYAVYLIHPVILVGFCVMIRFWVINPMVKFLVASFVTVMVSLLIAVILRRIPGMKKFI